MLPQSPIPLEQPTGSALAITDPPPADVSTAVQPPGLSNNVDSSTDTFCRKVRRVFWKLIMYLKLCCFAFTMVCKNLCQRSICCRKPSEEPVAPAPPELPQDALIPSGITHPEFDAERRYTRQLPAGSKPMTARGKNYIKGDKNTKVPRAETLYTLSKTFLFKSRYKEKFNNILEKQPATFKSLLDENGSNIFIQYILPPYQDSPYYRSFVACFSNERSFSDLKDHYASAAIEEDPENDDLFSKQQCAEVLYDFVNHYDKDARDKRLKTFAYVPTYQRETSRTTRMYAFGINSFSRPLFSAYGVTRQDYFSGSDNQYLEVLMDVSTAIPGRSRMYDPSRYVATLLSDAPFCKVQLSWILEVDKSEIPLCGIEMENIPLRGEDDFIDLDAADAGPAAATEDEPVPPGNQDQQAPLLTQIKDAVGLGFWAVYRRILNL